MEEPVNFCSESDEESGWTMYLEDFVCNNTENIEGCYSSLVSDAASLVMNNKSSDSDQRITDDRRFDHNPNPNPSEKRLNLVKKRKIRGADDALEDTATSPLNSPKVHDDMKNRFSKSTKQKDNTFNISEEKGNMGSRTSTDGDDDESLIIGRESELRKKGLCLVPMSMLVNCFP